MRIIKQQSLAAFWRKHPEAETPLRRWIKVVGAVSWTSMDDLVSTFRTAKIFDRERARFEVHAGRYRMVVSVWFRGEQVYIKFIGTHAEYDTIDPFTVNQF